MTGGLLPRGVRAHKNSVRSLFRVGVLSVLAAKRLFDGPRSAGAAWSALGTPVAARGEQLAILDQQHLSPGNSQQRSSMHITAHANFL